MRGRGGSWEALPSSPLLLVVTKGCSSEDTKPSSAKEVAPRTGDSPCCESGESGVAFVVTRGTWSPSNGSAATGRDLSGSVLLVSSVRIGSGVMVTGNCDSIITV